MSHHVIYSIQNCIQSAACRWTVQVYLTELNLILSIWLPIFHVPDVRCEHRAFLACLPETQYTQQTRGSCTCDGVMRWDVLQWAGKWRSVPRSWVMRWHTLKHYSSPYASLHSTSMIFFQSRKKDKNLCIHWSNIYVSRTYSAAFFLQLCFRGFKVTFLCCLKIAWEKIILHQHILCQCTFSCNFHFHLHMTEIINLLHFDLCSLCLSACLIVCLKNPCSLCHCSLAVNEHWSGIAEELNKQAYPLNVLTEGCLFLKDNMLFHLEKYAIRRPVIDIVPSVLLMGGCFLSVVG